MELYQQILNTWKEYDIKSEADIEKYLANFRILFAYNSSKIENQEVNYYDTRELFENGKVINFTGNPKTLLEQQNQKLAYEFLKQKIIDKELISVNLIKETHLILMAGTYDERRYLVNNERPGEFKKHDYIIGVNEVGTPSGMVEEEMEELVQEINHTFDEDKILTVAAYFHARFENIHAFVKNA